MCDCSVSFLTGMISVYEGFLNASKYTFETTLAIRLLMEDGSNTIKGRSWEAKGHKSTGGWRKCYRRW